jgi:hypothetical protein
MLMRPLLFGAFVVALAATPTQATLSRTTDRKNPYDLLNLRERADPSRNFQPKQAAEDDSNPKGIIAGDEKGLSQLATPNYTVTYPVSHEKDLPFPVITSVVARVHGRVEMQLGPFSTKVLIQVVDEIQLPGGKAVPTLWGTNFNRGELNTILIRFKAVSEEKLTELLYRARIKDLGIEPPALLSDGGLLYLFAPNQGFDPKAFEVLSKEGPLDLSGDLPNEFENEKEAQRFFARLRATAWLVVYHQVKVKGKDLSEVLSMKPDDFPAAKDAFADVEKRPKPKSKGKRDD